MKNSLKIYSELTILCVEDDESIGLMYKEMFSIIFKNVHIAKDGREGYELFKKENIDIILTDYSMPRMNGLEMSQKIREDDATIPIIMVTALESIEMLREAIDIRITSFIKKPFSSKAIFSTLEFVAKSVLADKLLIKEQSKQIEYSSYQENLTYEKEHIIIKNDFLKGENIADFRYELFFQPRDILSGDSYSLRKISHNRSLCFIVDGMGKGISASVTAMMSCAYLNHIVDMQRAKSLKEMIQELVTFIGKNLLEDEVVSISFLLFDDAKKVLEYAMFSMPAILYMQKDDENVLKIKSNNPPLASYTTTINVSQIPLQHITKLLCFSDGLNENRLKNSDGTYGDLLCNDFKESNTIESLEIKREQNIATQEDDVTYIFFNKEEL